MGYIMKVNLKKEEKMEKEKYTIRMEILYMKVIFLMIKRKEMEN